MVWFSELILCSEHVLAFHHALYLVPGIVHCPGSRLLCPDAFEKLLQSSGIIFVFRYFVGLRVVPPCVSCWSDGGHGPFDHVCSWVILLHSST